MHLVRFFYLKKQEANFTSLAVTGTLKGYDQLMNLVLDNVNEVTRGMLLSFGRRMKDH